MHVNLKSKCDIMRKQLLLLFILFISISLHAQYFSKITDGPVVTAISDSRSCNWIDFDNDGWPDIQITNGNEAGDDNMLFKNNGDGTFSQIGSGAIVNDNKPSDGATWGDYDNDGDADCFVVNWYGIDNLFYENNRDGTFTQILDENFVSDGGHSETASWGDYNNDGFLDLCVTNSGGTLKNFLYQNNGDKTFTKITGGAIANDAFTSRSVNWVDFNNDGNIDLFVSNEAGENENLYQNNGDATFTKITTGALVNDHGKTMSSSWGDIDNDGDQDVFLANDQGDDALFRNEGDGVFTKLTDDIICNNGGNSFGSNFADIDNDGDLDLFVTNSFWGSEWNNFLYINNGDGTFTQNTTDVTTTDFGWSYGNAFGDYDKDGDMDLVVANCYNEGQASSLYKNETTGNNWIVIDCEGVISNRSAIGAKIKVKSIINGNPVWQMREISAQTGYCGQNMLPVHFGLGNTEIIDSIIISWPSGITDLFADVADNQYKNVLEGEASSSVQDNFISGVSISPNPANGIIHLLFSLQSASQLNIRIYDLAGNKIFNLSDSVYAAGKQTIEIIPDNHLKMASGTYIIYLKTEHEIIAQKFIFTK